MKRFPNSLPHAGSDRHAVIFFLLSASIGCLLGTGTPAAAAVQVPFLRIQAAERFGGTLTFAERVRYQYAIEEVYWHHRIWPKDNPGPKPSLDEVMSPAKVAKKVENYLRESQAVEAQRHRPITVGDLQSEMGRLAAQTKQPDVLRELFAALGNDPFVIAECIARPILAERMLAERESASSAPIGQSGSDLDGKANREAIKNTSASAVAGIVRGAADPPEAAYNLPEISVPLDCMDNTWTATTTGNAPQARTTRGVVWTGSEMILWGGSNGQGLNTGGRYSPSTDTWTATSMTNAPTGRGSQSAVWTGSEMIIWGGIASASDTTTGGRYTPTTDTWITTGTANAPAPRDSHTAVWTGSEMIVWGGNGCGGNCILNSGGRYNPIADSWVSTSTENSPAARWNHRALWTGSEMLVWGGTDGMTYQHTGGRYNPATDSWTPTGLVNVPLGRYSFTAIWSGSEMIVWGGVDENFNDTNTGGRYNPVNNSWVATSLTSAPSPRAGHTGVWTGNEMIAWGGDDSSGFFNSGGRYNPNTDSWRATTTANTPGARADPTGIWTGSQMIVWGGIDLNGRLNTGGRYCAQPSAPVAQSAISRKTHGNTGSFDVSLPLSGTSGIECRSGGATSDYTLIVTFLANVSVNGNPQAAVTSGTGMIGSGGVSNTGTVTIAGNVVTIPLTNVANAQTIQITLNGVNGSTNFVIPMCVLIGDVNGNEVVNASDVALTKSGVAQTVNATNFRSDVNFSGSINASDVALVKSAVGTALP